MPVWELFPHSKKMQAVTRKYFCPPSARQRRLRDTPGTGIIPAPLFAARSFIQQPSMPPSSTDKQTRALLDALARVLAPLVRLLIARG
jgi:hypothetical protein